MKSLQAQGVNMTYVQRNHTRMPLEETNVRRASLQPSHTLKHTSFLKKRPTCSHANPLNKTGGTRLLNLSTNSSSFHLHPSKSLNHCWSCHPLLFFFSPYGDKEQAVSACRPVSSQSAVLCRLHTSLRGD